MNAPTDIQANTLLNEEPRKLWPFPGGIHLDDKKSLSAGKSIQSMPLSDYYIVPLRQHIGAPSEALVSVGDYVLKGQMLARCNDYINAPVHAPTSGYIDKVERLPVPHPSGLEAPCIGLRADGKDEWITREPIEDYRTVHPSELRNRLRESGIVGLGGALFPSAVKLNVAPQKHVETLIINGVECEPYITCDQQLMVEQPHEILKGVEIIQHLVSPEECLIAIEDNKPHSIASMKAAIIARGLERTSVVVVPTRYPSGSEKQLISLLTGKQVPSNKLPLDIGVVCHNVGTAKAIHRAISHGEPLISRIVTVTGTGIKEPANLEVRLGTSMAEVIAFCGGYTQGIEQLIMGGPMMGITLHTDELPIVKSSNCLLAIANQELGPRYAPSPCIRCASCVEACPIGLLPQQMHWYAKSNEFEKVSEYNIFDCIECGCCSYVCPSHIPLVQYFRYAKTEISAIEREKRAAEKAKKRHDFRQQRIETAKQRKAEAAAKKKAELQARKQATAGSAADDEKKNAIKAAMARAKQKKASLAPKNTDNLTPAQLKQIEEADARRASTPAAANDTEKDAKKAAIQAAMARAKAKKAARQKAQVSEADSDTTSVESDSAEAKRARIRAAQAKAKARKQQTDTAEEAPATESDAIAAEDDPAEAKRARIRAAQAKAKARKQQADTAEETPATESDAIAAEDDPAEAKRARIRAAQAKAKARKQQADTAEETPASESDATPAEDDPAEAKRARILAAQAKAKARRSSNNKSAE